MNGPRAVPGTGETNESQADDGVMAFTPELRELINNAARDHNRLDNVRDQANADKQAVRKDLKSKGIALKAFDAALRHSRLADADKRDDYDISYDFCRRALGNPIQAEMELGQAAE